MDEDIRAALFDGADEEGEFEELNDDFISQVGACCKLLSAGMAFDEYHSTLMLKLCRWCVVGADGERFRFRCTHRRADRQEVRLSPHLISRLFCSSHQLSEL